MADSLYYIDFFRDTFQTKSLFGSDFNKIVFKPTVFCGSTFRVKIDFLYRQQGGIKRLADRFIFDLDCSCHLFFRLACFLLKSGLLIGRHFLLCKQRQLVGVKRKVLLTHTAEHLLPKPIKGLLQGCHFPRKCIIFLAKPFILLYYCLYLFFRKHLYSNYYSLKIIKYAGIHNITVY